MEEEQSADFLRGCEKCVMVNDAQESLYKP